MRDFFKKIFSEIGKVWKKWSATQKILFFAVLVIAIVGIVVSLQVSGAPQAVPLLSRSITDQKELDAIVARLDRENVEYNITSDQRILVDSINTARRLRTILASEDLIPGSTDPWDLFDIERWTQTDFERNINFRRALTRQIEQHIESLDDVDAASVTLVLPEVELFIEDQNPVTASIILSIKPGSDIRESKMKIEGIQKLVQFAIEGLQADNITITDRNGVTLNDFEGNDSFDRLELTRRELKLKRELEQRYISSIYKALAQIYGEDRVEIVNIDVVIDTGTKTQETEEFFPIETIPDNPATPFSEREFVLAIPRSTEVIDESFEGTGFTPQGPPGQEGQTPPAYQDLENLVGRYNNDQQRTNNEVNARKTFEEKSPEISRITAAVAIDGLWKWNYDVEGNVIVNNDGSIEREYIEIDSRSLQNAQELVQDAVGYDASRGDSVSVRHLQFDRTSEFENEDQTYRRRSAIINGFIYALITLVGLFAIFVITRIALVASKKRKSRRSAELARQQELLRTSILEKEEGLSVPESETSDLLNRASNIARDHPDQVAQLMRSWLIGA